MQCACAILPSVARPALQYFSTLPHKRHDFRVKKKISYINPLKAELNPICHLLALLGAHHILHISRIKVNPSNAKLNPICHLLALLGAHHILHVSRIKVNPSNAMLNPICHLLALLGAHHILHVSRIRVKCVLILSTNSVWNISHLKKNSVRYYDKRPQAFF